MRQTKLLIAATLIFSPMLAQADFIGQTLDADYLFPDDASVFDDMSNEVVGAGAEWSLFNISIDASANAITLSRAGGITFSAGSFNGWSFTDVFATIADITSVTVDASTTIAGFDNSRISFDADSIFLNFVGLSDSENFFASVNVEFAAVPEPGTLALLGIGLLGMGAARRRKKA